MALKKLALFERFDWEAFSKDKVFSVTECKEWKDYNTGERLGTDVIVGIAVDKTVYKDTDGTVLQISNRFKELSFKVKKDVNIPVDAVVRPVNAIASRYSNRTDTLKLRNELSVKCDDIQVVPTQNGKVI